MRDISKPLEVFNPYSALSIARAIARYSKLIWPVLENSYTPREFLNVALLDSKKDLKNQGEF